MMAMETERAAPTLGSRLVSAVAGSSVCISSLQSSSTPSHHHPSPPSPAPSSSSSSEGSDGRGIGINGRISPGGHTGGEEDEHIDPVATTMSTTQATLTVSVHSRPASPIERRVHGECSSATGNPSMVGRDDDIHDVDVDSPPPSPLSPGDERRRSPTPPGLRGGSRGPESPSSCSSPPSVEVNAAEQRRRAAEERVSSPVVVVAPSDHVHHPHNHLQNQIAAPGPVRLTNFSIDAILKASFGAPTATRRDHRKQTSTSTSGPTARPLDVANLVATARHYSPHGIDHLVHGQKYIQQRNSSLLQGVAFTSGRAQGFVPYHPAGSRRAAVTPSSPPAARSPPLHPAHSSSAASSSPSFTYPEPGPAAGPTASATVKSASLSSRSHHHHPYLEAHHHHSHHHPHHPHHHPTPTSIHHLSHHHPHHHHHHNPRSPGVNSSSASSPAASPGGASSISSSSSCSPPTSSGGPRSPALLKTPIPTGDVRGGSPGGASRAAGAGSADGATSTTSSSSQGAVDPKDPLVWPAWVYCTRYSDRPSSGRRKRRAATSTQDSELADPWEGPRARKPSNKKEKEKLPVEKRPRTAFTNEQLARLKREFDDNRYLTETRRQDLAKELGLNESQIKIWFQNKRAKMKKATGVRNGLAIQLMAQGLYNHSTVPVNDDTGSESAGSPAKSS